MWKENRLNRENDMFCKFCGGENPEDAGFCKYCGKSIEKSDNKDTSISRKVESSIISGIICPACGASGQSIKADYCKKCGAKLHASVEDNTFLKEEDRPKTSIKEKKTVLKWLLIIPLIVVTIVIVVIFANKSRQTESVEGAEAPAPAEVPTLKSTASPKPTQEPQKESADESTTSKEAVIDDGDYTTLDFTDCNSFEEIINKLDGDMGYSNAVIGETEALLVTDFVIAGNAAINTEVYINKDNKPKYLGHVESDGTAYFLTINNNKLFVGGNHDMRAYTISSDKLLVDQEVIQEYDENGKEIFFYSSDIDKKEREPLADDSLWARLLDEFNKGTQIVYTAAALQPTGAASDENIEIYEKFINNEITVEDKTYSDFFADILPDFGFVPQNYYYDVDEDGINELLVDSIYGFDIFDVRNEELFWLAYGGGTADMCRIYRGNDHTYVAHLNFCSVGWESLELARYNGRGNKLESIVLYAEYAGDTYTSNGYYTCNNEVISMEEYKKYMESYTLVPIEEMKIAN